jgi:glycosyltransferase involved in cell wall biosynthesis
MTHSNLPLVSVVIPCYNHVAFVERAIQSVAEQTYPNIELIVIDDGSSDGSVEVIERQKNKGNIRHFEFVVQKNAGAHAAINRGLNLATGDFLTILNSDDYYYPARIEILVASCQDRRLVMAFTGCDCVDADGRLLPIGPNPRGWYHGALQRVSTCPTIGYALLRESISVTTGNFFFSRALFDQVGEFADFRLCHDWDFLMRSVFYTEPLFLPEPLLAYRVHGTNSVKTVLKYAAEEGPRALGNYLKLFEGGYPPNALAPHIMTWPLFFPVFVRLYSPWWTEEPLLTQLPFDCSMTIESADFDLQRWDDAGCERYIRGMASDGGAAGCRARDTFAFQCLVRAAFESSLSVR